MNVITDEKIKMCERILKNKINDQSMKKTLYGYLK